MFLPLMNLGANEQGLSDDWEQRRGEGEAKLHQKAHRRLKEESYIKHNKGLRLFGGRPFQEVREGKGSRVQGERKDGN